LHQQWLAAVLVQPELCFGSDLVDWMSDTVIISVPAKDKVFLSGAHCGNACAELVPVG
jgi:hypothetical protein